VSNRKPELAL